MRVLICGGRDYRDARRVRLTLDEAHLKHRFSLVIQGGARGADLLAEAWATARGVSCDTYHADWREGKAAGPIRNQRMIDQGRPELVIALPGGPGNGGYDAPSPRG